MAVAVDLRAFPRYSGEGICARFEEETVNVIDVSLAGVRVERPRRWGDLRDIDFVLDCATDGEQPAQLIPVRGHVVGEDADHLRISFRSVSSALAAVIDCFLQRHSAQPVSDYAYKPF